MAILFHFAVSISFLVPSVIRKARSISILENMWVTVLMLGKGSTDLQKKRIKLLKTRISYTFQKRGSSVPKRGYSIEKKAIKFFLHTF